MSNSLDIKYNNEIIYSTTESTNISVNTAGKFCTGNIEVDAEFLDTSDANATNEDILQGKSAYVNGTKIIGSLNKPIGKENDIIFIDYKGTIWYSYSREEILQLTELPPCPQFEGLIAVGWNWTLTDIKAEVNACALYDEFNLDVGCVYRTDDDTIRGYIDAQCHDFETTIQYQQTVANGITVNWGDGNEETHSEVNTAIVCTHIYSEPGQYVIKLFITSGYTNLNSFKMNDAWRLEFPNSKLQQNNAPFTTYKLKELILPIDPPRYMGSNGCSLHAFVSNGSWFGNQGTLYKGTPIQYLSLRKNMSGFGAWCMEGLGWLRRLYVSYNILYYSYPSSFADDNKFGNLYRITFAPTITTINSKRNPFRYIKVRSITIPSLVTEVKANYFQYITETLRIKFLPTDPPTLGDSNSFAGMPARCVILFPYASPDYLTGTNYPSSATYLYLGFYQGAIDTALPTSVIDSSETEYTLSWYATIEDARTSNNQIFNGNGKEVYCTYVTE